MAETTPTIFESDIAEWIHDPAARKQAMHFLLSNVTVDEIIARRHLHERITDEPPAEIEPETV